MGSNKSEVYLSSPEIVAISSINGYISSTGLLSPNNNNTSNGVLKKEILINEKDEFERNKVKIIDNFSKFMKGNIVFCYQDNLNTDGIYPGKYTYKENITKEQQAEVAMENYDPKFSILAKKGDILVGGYNFGTGSSREQAATSLKYKGIQCVIAGSFSETYKRNSLNNGFLCIEIPKLLEYLKKKFNQIDLTIQTNIESILDFENSILSFDSVNFSFSPIGEIAQELIVEGGLEKLIENKRKYAPKSQNRIMAENQ